MSKAVVFMGVVVSSFMNVKKRGPQGEIIAWRADVERFITFQINRISLNLQSNAISKLSI